MGSRILIRDLLQTDLPEVTRVHLAAFPESVLTRLGPGAVQRYYLWQFKGPHRCVKLGACEGDRLQGFAFAGKFNGALSGFLRENKWFMVGAVLVRPWLWLNPWFRTRLTMGTRSLLRTFTGKRSQASDRVKSNQAKSPPSFGILSIAVSPDAKRMGIGSLLMQRCEQSARQCGAQMMHLTVAVDNLEAIKFYEKLGWQQDFRAGEWKGGMLKRLT